MLPFAADTDGLRSADLRSRPFAKCTSVPHYVRRTGRDGGTSHDITALKLTDSERLVLDSFHFMNVISVVSSDVAVVIQDAFGRIASRSVTSPFHPQRTSGPPSCCQLSYCRESVSATNALSEGKMVA